jgi:hypothetical protein
VVARGESARIGRHYVDAPSSVVTAVVRDIERAPNANKKHLLFGTRGGGKSTQLGEIYRRLDGYLRLDLDLDRMGIEPARVTALISCTWLDWPR